MTEEGEVVDLGPIHLTAGSDATIKPTVEHSSAEGAQAFSIERRKHDQRVAAEEHKREEQRKNNELRWLPGEGALLRCALRPGAGFYLRNNRGGVR